MLVWVFYSAKFTPPQKIAVNATAYLHFVLYSARKEKETERGRCRSVLALHGIKRTGAITVFYSAS